MMTTHTADQAHADARSFAWGILIALCLTLGAVTAYFMSQTHADPAPGHKWVEVPQCEEDEVLTQWESFPNGPFACTHIDEVN